MAESSEPFFLLEGGNLDVNENMPISQNYTSSNEESSKDTSSIIYPENDSAYIETNPSENSVGCSKSSDNYTQLFTNNSDDIRIINDQFDSNLKSDSGIQDFENNIVERKLSEFDDIEQNLAENCGFIISDFSPEVCDNEFKDEEFHDAVQFFKDPSALVFLENAGSTNAPSEPSMARSSLYQKFDPLHAKFFPQSNMKSNEMQKIKEDEIDPETDNQESAFAAIKLQPGKEDVKENNNTAILIEIVSDQLQNDSSCLNDIVDSDISTGVVVNSDKIIPDIVNSVNVSDIVNKNLSHVSPRQSFGNILISFDSPVINKEAVTNVENEKESDTTKIYSEEELQQALKIQELTIQETFLKKQQELEESFLKKQQEFEAKFKEQRCLSNSLYSILKETVNLIYVFSDKEKMMQGKLELAEKENNKLKEDLKASVEDIQSVETTFSDFHKRYEQCKNMLKVYTENEKSFKQQIENMNMQLHEKEEMYKALQSRTEEMLDKANTEVSNAKKAGDAQIAVLKAQLKKAELKISSLESDVKHVKIENGKLSSICDELMAKVSES